MTQSIQHKIPGQFLWFVVVAVLLNAFSSYAQNIQALAAAFGGKVQVQREGERTWRKVTKSMSISDGDIIKTGYKSFMILRIDGKNQIIIGANTKMLFELISMEEDKNTDFFSKITIFEGALFFSWTSKSEVNVFSSDGMTAFTEGKFSVIYSRKQASTTVTVFSGKSSLQNIVKKNKTVIPFSHFTYVKPNENPVPPMPINNNHTEMLQKYFGKKFLSKELKKAGIQVREIKARKTVAKKETDKQKQTYEEETYLRPAFDISAIIKKVRNLKGKEHLQYSQPKWPENFNSKKYYFELKGNVLLTDPNRVSTTYYGTRLRGGMKIKTFRFALNLPFETDNKGSFNLGFNGMGGILDKIYYLDYANKKNNINIHLGEIRDLTFNRGTLVNRFSNEFRSQLQQPLGLLSVLEHSTFMRSTYFISDVGKFDLFGANIHYDNGWTSIGGSFVFDLNQGNGLSLGEGLTNDTSGVTRFRSNEPYPRDYKASSTTGVLGWDWNIDFHFTEAENLSVFGYIAGANLYAGGKGITGSVVQLPGIEIFYKNFKFGIEGLITRKRSHHGYFGEFYLEDRVRLNYFPSPNPSDTAPYFPKAFSQTERHPPMSSSLGFNVFFDWMPINGLWTGILYGRNFTVWPLPEDSSLNYIDKAVTSLNPNINTEFYVIGGKGLFPGLEKIQLYYRLRNGVFGRELIKPRDNDRKYKYHNGYFISYTEFLSLNTSMGLIVDYSILKNLSTIVEIRAYGYDYPGKGVYESGDLVSEFSSRFRMRF